MWPANPVSPHFSSSVLCWSQQLYVSLLYIYSFCWRALHTVDSALSLASPSLPMPQQILLIPQIPTQRFSPVELPVTSQAVPLPLPPTYTLPIVPVLCPAPGTVPILLSVCSLNAWVSPWHVGFAKAETTASDSYWISGSGPG